MTDNYVRKAKVAYIVDGDTFDAFVDLGYGIWTKQRFRMLEINTPERGQTNYAEAKQYLSDRIMGKEVYIESVKSDSFGRYLGMVYIDGVKVNLELIENGLAVKYEKK